MKKVQLLILATVTIASMNGFAGVTWPSGPNAPKSSIDLEKLKAQIKNEKHSSNSKTDATDIFEQQLFEDLVLRLQQDELVKLIDDKTLDNVLSFSALALQAWNPELKDMAIKTQISRNIVQFGFMKGFVTPMMTLIDLSYATGKPQFGNLLNVMLAEISPAVASSFEKNYNLPTSINGVNFTQLSSYGRDYMWKVLVSQIGTDLHVNFNQKLFQVDASLDDRINPMNYSDKSMDHFIDNTIKSKNSYLHQYFEIIGHEQSEITKGSLTKEMKKENTEKLVAKRGVFTNSLASETNTCLSKCMDEMGERITKYGDKGETIGTAAGAVVGKLAKTGAAAGAGIGGLIGKGLGSAVGVVAGGYACSQSSECTGKDNEKEKAAKEQKQKEIKEQNEKEAKAQREQIQKEQDENKKQQDEIKKQQEKHKNDIKKQEELKKQQQQLAKQQAELKKREEELKKKEDEQKKKDEEDKKKEDEKTNEEAIEEQGQSKTMQKEDDGPNKSFEEQQKMKQDSSSTPMTPADDFSPGARKTISKLDYIKAVKKEKSESSETRPILVYPKSPNSAE